MTLDAFTDQVRKASQSAPNLGKTLKIQLDEGPVFIDLTKDEAVVSNEDSDADTTVTTTIDTLDKLRSGDLNPMMAVMSGKVKIQGDMGLALKLQSLLG
jgi:putative sterol carrier protein